MNVSTVRLGQPELFVVLEVRGFRCVLSMMIQAQWEMFQSKSMNRLTPLFLRYLGVHMGGRPKPKSWRDEPCSLRQANLLLDLGIKTLPDTKGEASDLITDELRRRKAYDVNDWSGYDDDPPNTDCGYSDWYLEPPDGSD